MPGSPACRAATDPAAAAVLDRNGCSAVLRATYTDGTDSYVVTVGVAVLPSTAQAAAADSELSDAARCRRDRPRRATRWPSRAPRRPGSPTSGGSCPGSLRAGTYVALYTVGYADSRPREPVSGDSYADGEMTSVGSGVAQAVLAEVARAGADAALPGDARMLRSRLPARLGPGRLLAGGGLAVALAVGWPRSASRAARRAAPADSVRDQQAVGARHAQRAVRLAADRGRQRHRRGDRQRREPGRERPRPAR